jgi:hypothetical protein
MMNRRIPIVAAILLLAPSAASAATHSGHIRYLEPHNPPSIGEPQPPADQQAEYLREVLGRYNANSGTLTLEVEVWEPAYWGEKLLEGAAPFRKLTPVRLGVGATCEELSPPFEAGVSASPTPPPYAPEPPEAGEQASEHEYDEEIRKDEYGREVAASGIKAEASLAGYAGTVQGVGSFNGQRFMVSYVSPAFRDQNWRCVDVENADAFKLGNWPINRHQRTAAYCEAQYNRWRREEARGQHRHPPPAFCQV